MAKLRDSNTGPQGPSTHPTTGRRSQRTTPQAATQPERRATRQRSQQASSAPTSPQKTIAGVRHRNVSLDVAEGSDDALASQPGRSGKLRKVNRASQQHEGGLRDAAEADLDTVVEETEPQADQPDVEGDDAVSEDGAAAPGQSLFSPGTRSDLSGTTVQTSYHDLDSNKDELLASLPELHDYASTLLRRLTRDEPTEGAVTSILTDLHESSSSVKPRVWPLFEEIFEVFVTPPARFIRRAHVVQKILGGHPITDIPDGVWRPDEIIYKANLAAAIYRLMDGGFVDVNYLQGLDASFPLQFMADLADPHSTSGDSSLVQDTFKTALALRVQLAILRLEAEASSELFEPHDVLLAVFWESESDWARRASSRCKGWGIEVFEKADGALKKKYSQMVVNSVNSISDFFTGEGSDRMVDFDGLREFFGRIDFLRQVTGWAAKRNTELTASILQKGGVDMIASSLKDTDAGNGQEVLAPAATMLTPASMGLDGAAVLAKILKNYGTGGRKSLTLADTFPPRAKSQRAAGKSTDAAVANEGAGNIEMEDDVNDGGADAAPEGTYHEVFHAQSSMSASSPGKRKAPKKRLMDAQANAGKVSPINSQADPSQASFRRVLEPEAEDVSDDGGFSNQGDSAKAKQDSAAAFKRQQAKAFQNRGGSAGNTRVAKRPAEDDGNENFETRHESADEEVEEEDEEENRKAVSARAKKRKMSPPPEIPDAPPSTNYDNVNRAAKRETVMQNMGRDPQKRKPWTEEETEWFSYYMVQYGISWSRIQKVDANRHLANRGQVALKDKARNMKFDYLVNGVVMPKHLSLVPLPNNLLARLEAKGIDVTDERR